MFTTIVVLFSKKYPVGNMWPVQIKLCCFSFRSFALLTYFNPYIHIENWHWIKTLFYTIQSICQRFDFFDILFYSFSFPLFLEVFCAFVNEFATLFSISGKFRKLSCVGPLLFCISTCNLLFSCNLLFCCNDIVDGNYKPTT